MLFQKVVKNNNTTFYNINYLWRFFFPSHKLNKTKYLLQNNKGGKSRRNKEIIGGKMKKENMWNEELMIKKKGWKEMMVKMNFQKKQVGALS